MEDEVKITGTHIPHVTKLEPGETFNMIIPECCREGWETCEHVPKKQRKSKVNIGL